MSLTNSNTVSYDNFSVKKERESISQNKRLLFCFLVIFLVFIIPMALVISQSLRIVHLNYQLEELQGELSQISSTSKELEMQVASMRSLSRLEQVARRELGMVEPNQVQRLALVPIETEPGVEEAGSIWASLWEGFSSRVRAAPLD